MIVYFILFLFPAMAILSRISITTELRKQTILLYGLFLVLVVGLRYETGGDWFTYIENYAFLGQKDFVNVFVESLNNDYGFEALYWASLKMTGGPYFANLICSIIFVSGLLRFCNSMPNPWIAILIAVPYLIIVVGMGYVKQSAAIGFLLWGMVDLLSNRRTVFFVFLIFAMLFHKTAIFLSFFAFLYDKKSMKNIFYFSLFFILGGYILLYERIEFLYYHYILHPYNDAKGVFFRIVIHFVSVLSFFFFSKEWKAKYKDYRFWSLMAIFSILITPLAFIASTFVDRILLYMIPLQIVVLSRAPELIKTQYLKELFVSMVVIFYFIILILFFNFSYNAGSWIHYNNLLF